MYIEYTSTNNYTKFFVNVLIVMELQLDFTQITQSQ